MDIGTTLHIHERTAWRAWLEANHATASDIWLIYPRKHTGRPRIAYNDAVEEALCFGWIDSIVKKLDDDHTAQRFSPRRARSSYSQINRERLRRLVSLDRVHPDTLAALGDLLDEPFVPAPDILAALQSNATAWAHFQSFSPAYQRIRLAYVDSARGKPDDFRKRLDNLLRKTEQGNQFGFGIESYY